LIIAASARTIPAMARSSWDNTIAVVLVLALAWAGPVRAEPIAVALPAGRYLALVPPGLQGTPNLPAMMLLHGAWSSPEAFAEDAGIVDAFAADGVVLLLPAGIEGSWAARNAPRAASRDEILFLDAVRADAIARFALDPKRLRVGGFSVGASMAFDYACRPGVPVQAVLTIAGVVWQPMPPSCAVPPLPWMHVHGTADPTWPLAGRTIRGSFHQGAVDAALAMLAASFACQAPRRAASPDDLECEDFPGCRQGSRLRSCRHPGGHDLEPAWFRAFHAWVEAISTGQDRR